MKQVSLNIKIKLFTRKFYCQNHSQFKTFTGKSMKITKKFCEFDCLTGYSVLFLCYWKLISFLGYLKLILFLCYLILCYLVRNQKIVPGFK